VYEYYVRYFNGSALSSIFVSQIGVLIGLRKSTLTVKPALYTETKIITQDVESKPRVVNHKLKKRPKVNDEKNNKTKSAKTKPASEESPAPSPSKLLPQKYVLFVGNLPYAVTKEQLEEHFRKTGE
jgi:hypothetical protein